MAKKNKALMTAMANLEKRFGSGSVIKMGDGNKNVETITTGRADLDDILGGGFAKGKIIEIYGEEATGKTGIALEAIREVQNSGGVAAIVDAEHALNTEYCEKVGVDVDALYLAQPKSGEEGVEVTRTLIETGEVDLIIVDSIASMTPKRLLDGEAGEANMGIHAKLMGQFMKMIVSPAEEYSCTIILINQQRDSMAQYAPVKTTVGGHAIKFAASQRLEVKKKGQIKEGDEVIGYKQYVRCVKNKVSSPFKWIENNIIYEKGVDALTGIIEAAIKNEILVRKGAWYAYEDTNIAQGMKKLRIMLEDNSELVEEIQNKLKKN